MTRNASQPPRERPELASTAVTWLDGLFERLELDVQVQAREDKKTLVLNLVGNQAGETMGKSNQSPQLNALHTLLQSVLFPNERPWKQIIFDIGGNREQRTEQLQGFADWLSNKTTTLKKPITVLGMNSVDRRAVHIALEENSAVRTESEGFGPSRRLKIKHN